MKYTNEKPKNLSDLIKLSYNPNLQSQTYNRSAVVEVVSRGKVLYTYEIPPKIDPGTLIRGILEQQGRLGSSLVRYNRDKSKVLVVDVVTENTQEEHVFTYIGD